MTVEIAMDPIQGDQASNATQREAAEPRRKGPRPKYTNDDQRTAAIKASQDKYRNNQKAHGMKFYQRAVTTAEVEMLDRALDEHRQANPLPEGMFSRKPRRRQAESA